MADRSTLPFVSFVVCCLWISSSQGYQRYMPVGCFADRGNNRSMPKFIGSYRNHIKDWTNLTSSVIHCARIAEKEGMVYFGVQFFGECWSGKKAHLTYNKYGGSANCQLGVGQHWTNFVYRLTGVENECVENGTLRSKGRAQSLQTTSSYGCDDKNSGFKEGWYRFLPPAGTGMPTKCVPAFRCGTAASGWLEPRNTELKPGDGIVDGKVCFSWGGNCCAVWENIKVRNCGEFTVYKLKPLKSCPLGYCGNL